MSNKLWYEIVNEAIGGAGVSVTPPDGESIAEIDSQISALKSERDKYRAIALRLIRIYRVDDQAWAPNEEAEKMLEKEICK